MGRRVGYARVSTQEQNLERQIEALKKYVDEDMIVTDKMTGTTMDRAGYMSLKAGLGRLVAGDTLYIKSLDRLGRDKLDVKEELRYFSDIGVRVRIIDIPTTLIEREGEEWIFDMVNNIIIEVLASIAENEVRTTKQRQAEGIACMPIDPMTGKRRSLRTGRLTGRPPLVYPQNWDEVYKKWKDGEITAVRAAKELKLARSSFYKLVNKSKESI